MTETKKSRPIWAIILIVLVVLFTIIQPEFIPLTVPLIVILAAL